MLKDYDKFKASEPYYNGYRLLSTLDKHKRRPEIFIATSNRSAGKSVFFNGLLVHNFIQKKKKFCILYRCKYEIADCASGFFGEIEKYFFKGLRMYQEKGVDGIFDRLYISEKEDETGETAECCGYVTSISASDKLKRFSHLLNDTDVLLLDEAFPENERTYLPNEVPQLMSLHDSLARGNGEQSRYLPLIMVGNFIDIFNPYYESFGIVDDLQIQCNFYRGNGFVIEQGFNAESAKSHRESAFHMAFSGADYNKASEEKAFVKTSYQFIDKSVADIGRYICTIDYKGKSFSVRYNEQGFFYYCSNTIDPNYKLHLAATMDDVSDSAIYDPDNQYRNMLKKRLKLNQLKFKNLQCRNAIMHFLSGK